MLMHELARCAEAAAAAFADNVVSTLLEAITAYAAGLARLGVASGLDIVSAEHRVLAAIAAECGMVYKTCGAGGGDIGIALTVDADRLQAFRQRVAQAGLRTLDVQLEPHGLQVS
jgi:phosphomevalonate kinase